MGEAFQRNDEIDLQLYEEEKQGGFNLLQVVKEADASDQRQEENKEAQASIKQ